jgi:hypothetical protein
MSSMMRSTSMRHNIQHKHGMVQTDAATRPKSLSL